MRWLYATPSSATGRHRLATAYRRYLGLMSARTSPLAVAASSSDPGEALSVAETGASAASWRCVGWVERRRGTQYEPGGHSEQINESDNCEIEFGKNQR